jgi:hypothetical protein
MRWNLDGIELGCVLGVTSEQCWAAHWKRLGGELGASVGNGELVVVMSNLSSSMSSQMAPVSLLVPFTNISAQYMVLAQRSIERVSVVL